eukprot:4562118-Prymnesium_polylepis.2
MTSAPRRDALSAWPKAPSSAHIGTSLPAGAISIGHCHGRTHRSASGLHTRRWGRHHCAWRAHAAPARHSTPNTEHTLQG